MTVYVRRYLDVDINFNSHAHVERDALMQLNRLLMSNFNSHAHVERDQLNSYLLCAKLNFNSHAHVERDWQIWAVGYGLVEFQLTRSRGA